MKVPNPGRELERLTTANAALAEALQHERNRLEELEKQALLDKCELERLRAIVNECEAEPEDVAEGFWLAFADEDLEAEECNAFDTLEEALEQAPGWAYEHGRELDVEIAKVRPLRWADVISEGAVLRFLEDVESSFDWEEADPPSARRDVDLERLRKLLGSALWRGVSGLGFVQEIGKRLDVQIDNPVGLEEDEEKQEERLRRYDYGKASLKVAGGAS